MYPTMRTYFWKEDNRIVAQNFISGMKGQEHKHSLKDWEKWKKESQKMGIEIINLKEQK